MQLNLGVTLDAPGVAFDRPPGDPGVAFLVTPFDPTDDAGVTLRGGPALGDGGASPLQIGFALGGAQSGTQVAVQDGLAGDAGSLGLPLALSDVQLNGADVGLQIGPRGFVSLGPGPVIVGSASDAGPLGGRGIACEGRAVGTDYQQAFLREALGNGAPHGLSVIGQRIADIDVGDYCFLFLSRAPLLGPERDCSTARGDPIGVWVHGASVVALSGGAAINCMTRYGVWLSSAAGALEFSLYDGAIVGAGCAGVLLENGALAEIVNSSLSGNHVGLAIQDRPGGTSSVATDILGGTVACSTPGGPTTTCPFPGGIDLLNVSLLGSLDSQGTTFDRWDGGTDLWTCTDATLADCDCNGPTCPFADAGPLPSRATAVRLVTNQQLGGGLTISLGQPGGICTMPP